MFKALKPGIQGYLNFRNYKIQVYYIKRFVELLVRDKIDPQIAYNTIHKNIGRIVRNWEQEQKPIRTSIIDITDRSRIICALHKNKRLKLYVFDITSDPAFGARHNELMYYYLSRIMRFDPIVEDILVKDLVMIAVERRFKKLNRNGYYHILDSTVHIDLIRKSKNELVVLHADWNGVPATVEVS